MFTLSLLLGLNFAVISTVVVKVERTSRPRFVPERNPPNQFPTIPSIIFPLPYLLYIFPAVTLTRLASLNFQALIDKYATFLLSTSKG